MRTWSVGWHQRLLSAIQRHDYAVSLQEMQGHGASASERPERALPIFQMPGVRKWELARFLESNRRQMPSLWQAQNETYWRCYVRRLITSLQTCNKALAAASQASKLGRFFISICPLWHTSCMMFSGPRTEKSANVNRCPTYPLPSVKTWEVFLCSLSNVIGHISVCLFVRARYWVPLHQN